MNIFLHPKQARRVIVINDCSLASANQLVAYCQKIRAFNPASEFYLLFVFSNIPLPYFALPSVGRQRQRQLKTMQLHLARLGKRLGVPCKHQWVKEGNLSTLANATAKTLQASLLWPGQTATRPRHSLALKSCWHAKQVGPFDPMGLVKQVRLLRAHLLQPLSGLISCLTHKTARFLKLLTPSQTDNWPQTKHRYH